MYTSYNKYLVCIHTDIRNFNRENIRKRNLNPQIKILLLNSLIKKTHVPFTNIIRIFLPKKN